MDRGPREGKEEGTEPTEPRAEAGLGRERSHWPDGATQPETNRDPASLSTEAAAAGGASQGDPPSSGGEDGRTEALRAWGCQTEDARKRAASNVIY